MKKLLSGALALMLGVTCVGALAGCDNPDQEAVQTAMSAIKAMYVDKYVDASTPNDYELVGQYPINGTYCPITWTVNVTEGVSVKAMDETSKTVTVDVNEKTPTAVEYELTASITYKKATETYTFKNLKVPAYVVNTYTEYYEAEKDAVLRITGVVTGFAKKGDGASNNVVYMQDEDGAYYVYSLTESTLPDDLAIGKKLTVSGKKDIYSGTHELKDATIESIEDGSAVSPKDITDLVKAANDGKAESLVALESQLVTVKGVTVYNRESSDGSYYGFRLAKIDTYLRISSSVCPTSADNQAAIKTAHAANYGKTATVTGIVALYDGSFYLIPVGADAFKDFAESTATPAEKIAAEKEAVALAEKITDNGDVTLPTPSTYQDVTFSWASNNAAIVIADDNSKMTVTIPDEPTEVTVTLTIKCGDVTDTKEFKITVQAVAVKPGVYKLGLYQAKKAQKLYFTGTFDDKGFGTTTLDASQAADLVVAEATGGGYTLKIGAKFFELDANHKLALVDTATGAWKYDGALGVFTWTIGEGDSAKVYYLGTYNDFTTISASETFRISGDNADKVGVSQFPAYAEKYVATGAFKLSLYQAKIEKKLYFKGEVNKDNFGVTTENIAEAATVVVAAKENGYTLKVGEKYLELNAKNRLVFVDEATAVWAFDQDLGVFTWTIGEGDSAKVYYLGTYGTFNTISASETWRISGDKAADVGVSQFVAGMEKFAEAGTYKLSLRQANLSKKLYFKGELTDKNFGVTTENVAEAASVVVAAVDGGYTFKVGEQYLELDKNHKLVLVNAATGAWVFNQNLGVFTWTIGEGESAKVYYLGTYGTFDTISASETFRISDKNASSVGVSQFVLEFEKVEEE